MPAPSAGQEGPLRVVTLPEGDGPAGPTSASRRSVVLHIGAMKTGTTYLQGRVYANREVLGSAGVSIPGERWSAQIWAAQDLLGMGASDPELAKRNAGRWDALAAEIRGASAPVSLVSMEFLAFADVEQARRAVRSFGDRDVEVVLTVRDTAAVIPALWQTTVTSGGTVTWPQFRRAVRWSAAGRGLGASMMSRMGLPTASRFQEAVNISRILRVWTSVLEPSRIHVIVVPGPGAPRERLWDLYCGVLGADPATATEQGKSANESLGYPSAELVRRVNAAIEFGRARDHMVVKDDLGHNTLGRRRARERRALLDRRTLAATLRWNGAIRAAISAAGVRVHGDLADLPTEAAAWHQAEEGSGTPTQDELLAAARTGLRRMRVLVGRRSRRLLPERRARRMRRRLRRAVTGPAGWASAPDPVAAAVADLVVYADGLIELRRVRDRRRRRTSGRRSAR